MADDGQRTFPFSGDDLPRVSAARLQKLRTIELPANKSGAFFAVDIGTRQSFVVKLRIHSTDIVAESLGWLLSRELGVRTPDGSVVFSEAGANGWASSAIENVMGWDPDEADLCDQDDVAGIFVLDSLIGNTDRHADNVLVAHASADEPKSVYSIDLAQAWLGHPEGYAERGMQAPEVTPGRFLHGASRNLVEANAGPYLTRCRVLADTPGQLEGIAFKAHNWTGLLDRDDQAMVVKALRARLIQADALLSAFLDATLGPES